MQNSRTLFLNHVAQTSPAPLALEIDHAEGIYLVDKAGKKYVDLISGISVSNVGHRHPQVIKRINEQLERYMHVMVYGEYILDPQVQLAERISGLMHEGIDSVYFVNSGAEAIEGAMKLVKRATGRSGIISFKNAYHGSTQGALSMIGSEEFRTSFRPLIPGIRQVSFNDLSDLRHISKQTAAVFIEPVQGEAGIIPADPEYIQALVRRCKETGTLIVADEVQTGFGRTGKMFAYEHYNNFRPDIIVIAKGMGGGLPIGAFSSPKELMSKFTEQPVLGHITTFGGNPVCCAASLGVLDVLTVNQLTDKVQEKSKAIVDVLRSCKKISSIRHSGLLIGAEFETEEQNQKVIAECIKNGIITDWFLFNAKTLRIAPPLTITVKEATEAARIIVQSAEAVC